MDGRGPPAELGQPGDIEQLSWGAVRPRGIKTDLADIADGGGYYTGEFRDGDVLAGADVDQFAVRIGLHQINASIGEIIDIEKFAPRRPGAPDSNLFGT